MKFKILFLIFIISSFYLNSLDQIIQWDKSILKGDNIQFDGKNLYFKNEKTKTDIENSSYIKLNLTENDKKITDPNMEGLSVNDLLRIAGYMSKKYSDASVLVLLDSGIEKLNTDGSRYSRSRYSVKIMNEKELDRADLAFYEIPGKYDSKIIMARSISPDGEISNLSLDSISYTEPKQDLEFFSGRKDAKIMKATIPDVKAGSIIDYEWETNESKAEDPNQYYTQWYFAGEDPIYESSVKFILPENKDFFYSAKYFTPYSNKPVISKIEGYKIYTFKRGESAPFLPEPQGPPSGELIPFVKGSTFKNQDYLSDWLSKLMKERMLIDDTMKKAVDGILKDAGAKTNDEKITVLYRFMQDYIRYLSIKTSLSSGFSGHKATETFYNKYGDCIDKSILFAAILNYCGIDAYPVIVMTSDQEQPLYGELGLVEGNHAINELHLKNPDRIIYLDTTSTTYKYPYFRTDDHGIKAWNPILNTVRTIDPPPIDQNTQNYSASITLSDTGDGNIKKKNIYKGQMDAGLREYFLSLNDIQKKSLMRNIINGEYPGSNLLSYENSPPSDYNNDFSLEYSYDAQGIAKKINNYLVLNIPVKYGFTYTNLTERKYPLIFETTIAENNNVEIILPAGYSPKAMPNPISIKSEYINYEGKYSLVSGKIIFTDTYKRTKMNIPPGAYKEFRKIVLKINNFTNIPVVLEKK
jgi:hypothetical protein